MRLCATTTAILVILIACTDRAGAKQPFDGPPPTRVNIATPPTVMLPGEDSGRVTPTALIEDAPGVPIDDCDTCDDIYLTTSCGPCWQFYGEFLYLRPGADKVSYAVPINGGIVPPAGVAPVQIGREGIVDNGFSPGFRIGLGRALTECSSIGGSYTYFESDTSDSLAQGAPFVLRSKVHHPGTANAATDFLQADAAYSIDFQIADVEYGRLLTSGELHALRYVIGARYGQLEQGFESIFSNSTGTETVISDVNFTGGGLRFGLEGERHAACSGWMVYAKGNASFIGGEFTGSYTQGDTFGGTVVDTGWADDRIVSIIDAELGLGYTCHDGCIRFTTGYLVSAWSNVVTTDDFIGSVQTNYSSDVSDTITFDGLTSRFEVRY